MAELNRSDDTTNLGPGQLAINQGQFRTQQDVIGDSLLQLGGKGNVTPGFEQNDPLNAPFVLYVNPYIGKDDIAFGSYANDPTSTVEAELKRIESQRLVCGYTEAAPFKTLNRAVIEAGLITSKSYLSAGTLPFQRVCIVLSAGTYDLVCGAGVAASAVTAYDPSTDVVDAAYLQQFNPETVGGVIIPRGGSVTSLDLRKTILRPAAGTVPAPADEAADYSNRRTMLRMTGEGYYYGMTFMDEGDNATSHHLMSCFEFCSQAQLDEFYTKLDNAFGSIAAANLSTPASRDTEWQIVGPQPAVGSLTEATDTTASASPYIYNCSIRSEYGLCGLFANGAGVGGFRSVVIAQYTGVSLQNDYTCWQQYSGGAWGAVSNFTEYRNADPDDIRMNPNRRSFHIRAINRAVIQEVSVFAIGQGIHHWTQGAGEITCTNSNSNFGGCAGLSEGYASDAPPQDTGFSATHQRVPTDLSELTNNVRRVYIGTIDSGVANNATAIQLTANLTGTVDNEPDVLGDYTLVPGSYVWVESPTTGDYRAQLTSMGWDASANQDTINITSAFQTDDSDGTNHSPGDDILNGGVPTGQQYPDLAGRRLYVRRIIDVRSQDERRYALLLEQPAAARLPQRDYIARIDGDGVGNTATVDTAVLRAGKTTLANSSPAVTRTQVEFKQINPDDSFRANSVYRPGDVLSSDNKHWICTRQFESESSLTTAVRNANFESNFVHMAEAYNPEDFFKNVQPVLIFDHDSDQLEASTTLGWIWSGAGSVWTATDARSLQVQKQYKSATDYRGLERWLTTNGGPAIADPQVAASRDVAFPGAITSVEFRRPSVVRMYGQAYEWAGFGNYTKGLPQYQGGMNGANKFTYYGTNELGGRVYFTGFNEEGFSVSPRGIEDIQTGEVLSSEQIDSPDLELDFPTTFDNLTVLDGLTTQDITINGLVGGTPNWGDTLPVATAGVQGIIELATVQESAAGTDDTRAVTPAGLSGAVTNGVNLASPCGVIQWFAGSTAPTGWLVCNGDAVPNGSGTVQGVTEDFSYLFAVLGTTYGTVGADRKLPDLQGTFVRGWTDSDSSAYNVTTNPDPSRVFGTRQDDAAIDHSHDYTDPQHNHGNGNVGGNCEPGGQSQSAVGDTGAASTEIVVNGISRSTSTGTYDGSIKTDKVSGDETRPVNIALLPIIKI